MAFLWSSLVSPWIPKKAYGFPMRFISIPMELHSFPMVFRGFPKYSYGFQRIYVEILCLRNSGGPAQSIYEKSMRYL